MQTRQPTILALITGLALATLALPSAYAIDKLPRKSGMWEMKVETTTPGQPSPAPTSWQVCIDGKQDDIAAPNSRDSSKPCAKEEMKRSANEIAIDSVCKFDDIAATGHSVITGDLDSSYRMENTTRFDPPLHGVKISTSVTTGKWLGPCKAAQPHGGMSGARLDPEAIKQLQQSQEKKQ
jgi:hypothetical protein